jgi:hypothetical protein
LILAIEVAICDLKLGRQTNHALTIDNKAVYHFGASLKDLGKKWFAFSKMDIGVGETLKRMEGTG